MSSEGNEVGPKAFWVPLIVAFDISFGICTTTPMLGFAAQPIPSTDATGTSAEASMSANQADAKIQSLLGQIETAIAQGRMLSPPNDNAIEILSVALAMLPLASPQGESLMTAFPLVLRQHAGQHPQNDADFLVFSNVVSLILSSTDRVNRTHIHPQAATNGGQGIVEHQPLSGAAPADMPGSATARTDAAAAMSSAPQAPSIRDVPQVRQPAPANTTRIPPVAGGPPDRMPAPGPAKTDSATAGMEQAPGFGSMKGPSVSVAAAPPSTTVSPSNSPVTGKAAERMKPKPTPRNAWANDSGFLPNSAPATSGQPPAPAAPGLLGAQQQPRSTAQHFSTAVGGSMGKSEAPPPGPLREAARPAQPMPANAVPILPVAGSERDSMLSKQTASPRLPSTSSLNPSTEPRPGTGGSVGTPSLSVSAGMASPPAASVLGDVPAGAKASELAGPVSKLADNGDHSPNAVTRNSQATATPPVTRKADDGKQRENPVHYSSSAAAATPDQRSRTEARIEASPSVSAGATPPVVMSSAPDLPVTGKAVPTKSVKPTPALAPESNSNHLQVAVAVNTGSAAPAIPAAQQQPQSPAPQLATGTAVTPDKTGDPALPELRHDQPFGKQADSPPVLQDHSVSHNMQTSTAPVAEGASSAASDGTSHEVKLALARPPAELPQTPAFEPKPPAKQPNAISPEFVRALVQRGDGLILLGDISGARRLYTLAAEDGDGQAARRLGDTYSPEFLADHHVQGLQPDLNTAGAWYRKAAALGNSEASGILSHLTSSGR
jgi:hypothetical protein